MRKGSGATDNKNVQKHHTVEINAKLLGGGKPVLKSILKDKMGTKESNVTKSDSSKSGLDASSNQASVDGGVNVTMTRADCDDVQVGAAMPHKIPEVNISDDGVFSVSEQVGGEQPHKIPVRYTDHPVKGLDRLEAVTEVVQEPIQNHSRNLFNAAKPGISFANVVAKEATPNNVNFRAVETSVPENSDFDVGIPISSVEEVNNRLHNSLYGYFIGKRLAYPVVENYVRNAWSKFGVQKIMMNSNGFFFFKFTSMKDVDNVLQNGPWMIRGVPIILNKWDPSVSLAKEDLTKVPAWVKMHNVPIAGFTADGLSIIATKIGTPTCQKESFF